MKPKLRIKLCKVCAKQCIPLTTPISGPRHSEWYCPECHISYLMDKQAAVVITNTESQQRQAAQRKS